MMVQVGYYYPRSGEDDSFSEIVMWDPTDPDQTIPNLDNVRSIHDINRLDLPSHGDGPVFISRVVPAGYSCHRGDRKYTIVKSSTEVFTYSFHLYGGGVRTHYWRYIVKGDVWYQVIAYRDTGDTQWSSDLCSGKFGEAQGVRLPWGPNVPTHIANSSYELVLDYLISRYCNGSLAGYERFRSMRDLGSTLNFDPIPPCEYDFSDGQYTYWSSRVLGLPYSGLRVSTSCFGQAYYKAVGALPRLQQNMFANIVSCVDTIRSFKEGYKTILKASDIAKEAWLSYRYVYNTTVSDMTEFEQACERLLSLSTSNGVVTSYGDAYDSRGAHYKCAVKCKSSSLLPKSIKGWAKEANLRLDMMNVWDVIPYSFIVDWFADVGTILDGLDAWLQAPEYDISEIWYSYTESQQVPTGEQSIYFRWRGKAPALPHIDWMSDPSGRTIFMRFADTISLFF